MGIRQMPTLVYEWGGGIIGLFTYVRRQIWALYIEFFHNFLSKFPIFRITPKILL